MAQPPVTPRSSRKTASTSAVLAGLATMAACSLAGLDEYASGTTGQGAGGHATGGQASGGQASGGQASGGLDAGPDAPACDGGSLCGGACVDTSADAANCGGCGVTCAPGYGCLDGVCGNAVVDASNFLASCAVLRNGELWCWGRDVLGEIGIPPSVADTTCPFYSDKCQVAPVKVAGISDAVEVSMGAESTCVRTAAGEVWCWGSNEKGMLGHDPASDPLCSKAGGPDANASIRCSPTPQKVAFPAGTVVVQIAMGTVVACARTATRDVYCWGKNANGEVKSPVGGTFWQATKNANVVGDADDLAISGDMMGDYSTVCVRRSGTGNVRCWGGSSGGTLFTPATGTNCANAPCDAVARTVPQVFAAQSGAVQAERVQVGWLVGCGLSQGTLTCWGDDNYGQSGKGAGSPGAAHFDPTPVAGLPEIASFSMRFLTTMAVDKAGAAWLLGWVDEGEAGDGTYGTEACPVGNGQKCVNTPKKIPGLANVTKVVAAGNNAAAITRDGKLWMWGANFTATLGHAPGTSGDTLCGGSGTDLCNTVPQIVKGLPGATIGP